MATGKANLIPKVYVKDQYYTVDGTFGFANTGITVAEGVIIGAFTPFDDNICVRFSKANNDQRLQIIDALDGSIKLGATYYVYIYYLKRIEIET